MANKSERAEQKRNSILEAAIKAFRDEGYETTSMDRIAELAGASKRTVYNYFGSKEALFQAVVSGLIQRMVAAVHELVWDPDRPLAEPLTDYARAKASIADNPDWLGLLRVVLGVFVRHPDMARETMEQAEKGACALIRWMEAARDAGQLKILDVQLSAKLFGAMVSGALFWPAVLEGPMEPTERDRIIGELVETFLARYRA